MIRTAKGNHRVTVNERGERRFRFVRRVRRCDEINRVEMEAPLRGLRDGDVAAVNRIESAAE